MDSGETASDASEFSDRDEDDCKTDASSSQVRLRLSGSDVQRTLTHWATASSFVRHQVLGNPSPSPAIRIGNGSMPPAETPAVTSPAIGTLCPLCQKQFTSWLSDVNLVAHQKSKPCQRKQTATGNPSSETNLLSAFNPSPLPLSTTASADEFEEPSQAAEEKAAKKRQRKRAERGRRAERYRMAKEAKRLTAEVERADLDVNREACLVALREEAVHDPSLLEAICQQDKACNNAACILMHHCTRKGGSDCKRLVRGYPSNSTKPGHSARQLLCSDCLEKTRRDCKKYRDSKTKDEKKAMEKKRKREGKTKGTANPVAVLEGDFQRLKPIIEKQHDWGLLAKPGLKLFCCDFEFAALHTGLTAPSETLSQPGADWDGLVIFDICASVLDPAGRALINERVNFLPEDYKLGPIPFLQSLLPNNCDRAFNSLSRVHGGLEVTDTAESNAELQHRLMACKSMAQITDMLADVARKVKEEGAIWAVHGTFRRYRLLSICTASLGLRNSLAVRC